MIIHAYSFYVPRDKNTMRRMTLAQRTWAMQPWHECPINDNDVRMFTDESGSVPYIRDLFSKAVHGRQDRDIIVFTNSDTCVSFHCSYIIVGALLGSDAAYGFRRDFPFLNTPIPNELIQSGTEYIGCDLFAFRVGWWLGYEGTFPDMLLGREAWDCLLRILMDWTNEDRRSALPDIIYHERHSTVWENHKNRHKLPSQLHNLRLAKEWLNAYKVDYSRFGIK